ncbi:MAG: helix-turn-helix transcriptional regulator [Olsenella sp.]|nr:helix-turn-helix transcriptional regulator [Olsenella sp.]
MQNLRGVREMRGLTQKEVADKLGITRQTYAIYEANQERMTIEQAKAVCRLLKCDLEDVFLSSNVK